MQNTVESIWGGGAIFVDLLDCLNFAGSWGRNPLTPTKGYMTI